MLDLLALLEMWSVEIAADEDGDNGDKSNVGSVWTTGLGILLFTFARIGMRLGVIIFCSGFCVGDVRLLHPQHNGTVKFYNEQSIEKIEVSPVYGAGDVWQAIYTCINFK